MANDRKTLTNAVPETAPNGSDAGAEAEYTWW